MATPGRTRPGPAPIPGPTPVPDSRDREQFPGGQQNRTTSPDTRRQTVISGKVVMDDGTPAPDGVVIECVRNGVARPEAYTDAKGRFSFQLGQSSYMIPDARVVGSGAGGRSPGISTDRPLGGRTGANQTSCGELRASFQGYRSSVVLIGNNQMYYSDVGTIILRRTASTEGATISLTSLEAPKDARTAYEKGRKESEREKWRASEQQFEKAIRIYPRYAATWFELGKSLEGQGKVAEAREAYGKAVEADSKFLDPYMRLASLAANEKKWQEVSDTVAQVIRLNPVDFPEAHYLHAAANYNLHNLDAAEQSSREVLKLDSEQRFPAVHNLLGLILAARGDFAGAAAQMSEYLRVVPDAGDAGIVRGRLAEAERRALISSAKRP